MDREKYDKTMLKNLLKKYRNDIITNNCTNNPNINAKTSCVQIDYSIFKIINNL